MGEDKVIFGLISAESFYIDIEITSLKMKFHMKIRQTYIGRITFHSDQPSLEFELISLL
jgi:hypothetical protein